MKGLEFDPVLPCVDPGAPSGGDASAAPKAGKVAAIGATAGV